MRCQSGDESAHRRNELADALVIKKYQSSIRSNETGKTITETHSPSGVNFKLVSAFQFYDERTKWLTVAK